MLDVLTAQHRQLSHDQARMAAVLAELGRFAGSAPAGRVARRDAMDRYAPDETRAALRWTRSAADFEHDVAETRRLAVRCARPARVLVLNRYLAVVAAAVADPVAGSATTGSGGDGRNRSRSAAAGLAAAGSAAARSTGTGPAGTGPVGRPGARDSRVGIEIRAALSTLLGLDEHPGEIPGLGLLGAAATRARVALQRRAQWRFAVTDAAGRLISEGITRRRPHTVGGHPVGRDGPLGGIVEIHIPAALLDELVAGGTAASGGCAGVVARIAAQHAPPPRAPRRPRRPPRPQVPHRRAAPAHREPGPHLRLPRLSPPRDGVPGRSHA